MWKLKRLTAREREGLLLVGAGVGNRERQRSRELGIAERKATAHIARIVEKLGQWSRLQVAVLAAVLPGSTGRGSRRVRVAGVRTFAVRTGRCPFRRAAPGTSRRINPGPPASVSSGLRAAPGCPPLGAVTFRDLPNSASSPLCSWSGVGRFEGGRCHHSGSNSMWMPCRSAASSSSCSGSHSVSGSLGRRT
ncbi:helix-turn-helix domain-containing protein [Streptomyces decoyicus]